MKINSENCEAWFLDYYEGNLSKEGVEELFAFLVLNPELREVFDSYEEVSFSPDKQVQFDAKPELKKPVDLAEGITENNYEEYFVSHVEGLLNAEEQEQLAKFLMRFPAKCEELELLQQAILLPDETIVFEHKASLRKSVLVSDENFEEMAIASVEGLLNAEEEKALADTVAANAEQQKAAALFAQTKLSPDASIVFEDKESLKRKERGAFRWLLDTRFAAAASVALLIGIFFWNYSGNEQIITGTGNDVAVGDTGKTNRTIKTNPSITPNATVKDPVATTNDNKIVPQQKDPVRVKENDEIKLVSVPSPVKNEKQPLQFISTNGQKQLLSSAVINPQVDFSDAYYADVNYAALPAPVASTNTSISPRQAAMRWMKKKLDRTPAKEEENVYMAAMPTGNNSDVSGFDLTSSAVAALGNATGSNLRLGHQPEGTVLTVGKYELLLSRNN